MTQRSLQRRKLKAFRDYYNESRVHRSLAGTTPAQHAGMSSPPPPCPSSSPTCGSSIVRGYSKLRWRLDYEFATHRPQRVSVHGRDEVVIIAAEDFRRLSGAHNGRELIAAIQSSPYRETEIEPTRLAMPVRDVTL